MFHNRVTLPEVLPTSILKVLKAEEPEMIIKSHSAVFPVVGIPKGRGEVDGPAGLGETVGGLVTGGTNGVGGNGGREVAGGGGGIMVGGNGVGGARDGGI